MDNQQITNLLGVCHALRECDPKQFDMNDFSKCAIFHYAKREDLQNFIHIDNYGNIVFNDTEYLFIFSVMQVFLVRHQMVLDHFGLNKAEALELFGTNGCGGAKTPKEAIKYIRKFIENLLIPFIGSYYADVFVAKLEDY